MHYSARKIYRATCLFLTVFLVLFTYNGIQAVPVQSISFNSVDEYSTSTSTLYAAWTIEGDFFDTDHYEIGTTTTAGSSNDIENWIELASADSDHTFENEELIDGTTYYICLRAISAENEVLENCTDGTTIDTSAPIVEVSINGFNATSTYEEMALLSLTAEDASSGVSGVYYCIIDQTDPDCNDTSVYQSYEGELEFADYDNFTVYYYAQDNIGNESIPEYVSFEVSADETDPTVLEVNSPDPDGIYIKDDEIILTVKFSEDVFVDTSGGIPYLQLDEDESNPIASYYDGSGSSTLYFSYIVEEGDATDDLNYSGSGSLFLNGGIINDHVNREANVLLPDPEDSNSECLANNKNIQINAALVRTDDNYFSLPDGCEMSSTTQITSYGTSTFSVSQNTGTSTVTIGTSTMITKSDGSSFNGTLLAAADISSTSLSGLGAGIVVDGSVQWGIAGLGLNFDPAIRIDLYLGAEQEGNTLTILRSVSGTSDWTDIGIEAPGTCTVSSGICTFYATKASYYAATRDTSTGENTGSSSGGASILFLKNNSTAVATATDCETVAYSDWNNFCSADGYEYRYVDSQYPSGCVLTEDQIEDKRRLCTLGKTAEITKAVIIPKVLGEKIYGEGSIFKDKKGYYYIYKNDWLEAISRSAANAGGQNIQSISEAELAKFGLIKALIKDASNKIYVVKNRAKKHILNLKELQKYFLWPHYKI